MKEPSISKGVLEKKKKKKSVVVVEESAKKEERLADLEVSVLTRIRDQCIQARCTVGGSTPSVYYRGCPILQHSHPSCALPCLHGAHDA